MKQVAALTLEDDQMNQTPLLTNNSLISASVLTHRQAEKPTREVPFFKLLEILERSRQWSERDVLLRLAVPRTTYRSWRDGTSEPSKRAYWIKLSQVFGVPIEALIRADLAFITRRTA